MDPTAPVSRQASVTMRCDPWGPVITRLVFCLVCGGLGIDNAMMFKPWAPGPDWLDAILAVVLIGIGIWSVIAWLSSWLTIDRVNNRLLLKRFTFWDINEGQPRVIPLDAIAAVVLKPQRRVQLLKPNRIELRLSDGERVVVSTIASLMGGMAVQAQEIADAIDCAYEEQDAPDKK
ncbi:MAG TPA: hypothetical protein VHX19_20645 [Stellaceae bacterium]|jgi:hypothetical protein|nr:hypothetical protein [Stellaceae bacterium]